MKLKILFILFLLNISLYAGVEVIESSRNFYLLEITFQDYSIEDDGEFTIISSKWNNEAKSGAPSLPLSNIKFIVPPDGELQASVISKEHEFIKINHPIKPAPYYNRDTKQYEYKIDSKKYNNYEVLVAKEKTRFRFYNYVPIEIRPVILEDNGILVHKKILIEVNITGNDNSADNIQDKFSNIYREMFINFNHNGSFTSRPERKSNAMPFSKADFWYKLTYSDSGIYRLQEELESLPEFVDLKTIRIFGFKKDKEKIVAQELPLQEEDNSLIFNSEGLFGKVAWLTFGGRFDKAPLRKNIEIKFEPQKIVNLLNKDVKELTRERNEYNSIIITPAEFEEYAYELADLHELNFNIKTLVIDQQNIFDQNAESPIAIKRFLETQFSLPGGEDLESVILLGAGTREWEVNSNKNRIITYGGRDDNYVSFSGSYPDLAISRIPVKTISELDLVFSRIKNYIESPNMGWWRNTVLLTADDEHKNEGLEGIGVSASFNHTQKCEIVDAIIRDYVETDKVYGIEYNFDEYNNKPDARDAIIKEVNEGCLIWYYVGHGDEEVLGDEEYFKGSLHLPFLENSDMLNLFIAGSCNVGHFDELGFDSLAEKILFQQNGGSIASIAASRGSFPGPNAVLFEKFFQNVIIERMSVGMGLWQAKLQATSITNSTLYHLFGNIYLPILSPEISGEITGLPESVNAKQTVSFEGQFTQNEFNAEGSARVYDSSTWINYTNSIPPDTMEYYVTYLRKGNKIYNANISVAQGNFEGQFIVPVGIDGGDMGQLAVYYADEINNKEYISYYRPLILNQEAIDVENQEPPEINLWLDSKKFASGDYVSTNPLLLAHIQDENGINISGAPGRRILALLDGSDDPNDLIDVTSGFIYNTDSYTEGELSWQLHDLEEGRHTLQLIVYDNFGNSALEEVGFFAQNAKHLTIRDMLVYPNPVKKDAHFTFVVTEDSEVKLSIYTITGRKIYTISRSVTKGYNQIYWHGRDADGDRLANNTYFYKIRAKQPNNGKVTEEIGKLIISK
ncbi:MAG: C25 family cysteine peptidase [Candidatus Cloacimonadota bacterium]|nr:C25 family cysteine peptidase [Candidatus Cloacimonadota bacterium]